MPDRRDALVRLCQTHMFQNAAFTVFDGLMPKNGPGAEEGKDALHILLRWYCLDQRILKSDSRPHPCNAAEHPGAPVCLLMVIMSEDEPPAGGTPEYELYMKAAELQNQFWAVTEPLFDKGFEARFEDVLPRDRENFVRCAMDFAREFVQFSNPDPDIKARIECLIPDSFDGYQSGGEPEVTLFLKVKAFYYGLFGHSLSVVELARLRAQRAARLQAM